MTWVECASLFTLGFSSLFPLINPIGTALIINAKLSQGTGQERLSHSANICWICFAMGVATLFAGSWVLKFMGISIASTQMAGGLVLAHMGMALLNSESEGANDKTQIKPMGDSLFYPLAFPLTLGPGGIATLITLSAHAHAEAIGETFLRMGILAVGLGAVLLVTYFCFAYTNLLIARIGKTGSQALNRLMAFVVFSIGIQMFVTGLSHAFPNMFR